MYNKETRRTKVVTFRISQEEYRTLEAACTTRRLRSISDLTRDAVLQWIRGPGYNGALPAPPSSPSETELERVENCIEVLAQELERLRCLVQTQKNGAGSRPSLPSAAWTQP